MVKQHKICVITVLHRSNDNRIFRRECCSLLSKGFDVHFIAPDDEPPEKTDIKYHSIKRYGNIFKRVFWGNWKVLKLALSINADIYHYHDPEFIPLGFLMAVMGKKVVFDVHESVHNQIKGKGWIPKPLRILVSRFYLLAERLLTKNQGLIVANRRSVDDYKRKVYLVQNYPILRDDLWNSYDRNKFESKPLIVYVGGVSMVRGADVYVELAGKLKQAGYSFEMKIIGWNCGNTVEQLSGRVSELEVEECLEFTGGLDWLEAMKLMTKAHIGLCLLRPIPNYTKCLATKIVEYMLLGIPTLCSDFDVWRPYVEGENTGLMADPEDIDDIFEKCSSMLDNRQTLEEMADRGRLAVQEKYNWDIEFQSLILCYNDLLIN